MLASYVLRSLWLPTLVMFFLCYHAQEGGTEAKAVRRFDARSKVGSERMRNGDCNWLHACLCDRRPFAVCFLAFCASSCLLTPFLGEDFFPKVDAGQMRLHVRAKTGTRVEETAALCDHVEALIRRIIPARELESIVDNIGLPTSGINNSYNNGGTSGHSTRKFSFRSTGKITMPPRATSASSATI